MFVIGVIAIGVFVVAPRVVEKGKGWLNTQIDESKRRNAIESGWQPPGERPDANWFPVAVDKWTLGVSESISTVPEILLDRPGRRANYRGEKQDCEVIVIPVSDLELQSVFDRAASALRTDTGGSQMTTRTPGRLYVRTHGDRHTRLWWIRDWLFIFRTVGPEEPDAFAEKFLETMRPAELEKR